MNYEARGKRRLGWILVAALFAIIGPGMIIYPEIYGSILTGVLGTFTPLISALFLGDAYFHNQRGQGN